MRAVACRGCATTAASPPGPITVFVRTVVSYCRYTHACSRSSATTAAARSVQRGSRLLRALGDARRRRARAARESRRSLAPRACTIGQSVTSRDPGELGDDAIALGHAIHRLGDHLADDRRGEVPLLEDRAARRLRGPCLRDDEHALLRLAEQDLVRRHAFLAHRHFASMSIVDADVAARRHLRRRRREAGRAHVLDGDDVRRCGSARAIASSSSFSVNGSPTCTRGRFASLSSRQVLRRERRAVNAVAPGARADGDDRIADALRDGADQLLFAHARRRTSR